MNDQDPRQTPDWVEDAKAEISGMAKEGVNHPSTKPVLIGTGIGALVGALIIGGPVLGGLAGASLSSMLKMLSSAEACALGDASAEAVALFFAGGLLIREKKDDETRR